MYMHSAMSVLLGSRVPGKSCQHLVISYQSKTVIVVFSNIQQNSQCFGTQLAF